MLFVQLPMYVDSVVVFSDRLIVEPSIWACGDGCVGCQVILLLVQITWWLVRAPPLVKGGLVQSALLVFHHVGEGGVAVPAVPP